MEGSPKGTNAGYWARLRQRARKKERVRKRGQVKWVFQNFGSEVGIIVGVYGTRNLPSLWWLAVGCVLGISIGSLLGWATWFVVKDKVDPGTVMAFYFKSQVVAAILGFGMALVGVYVFVTMGELIGLVATLFFGLGGWYLIRQRDVI